MQYRVNLKIADVIVRFQSCYPIQRFPREKWLNSAGQSYEAFLYSGKRSPDILIEVKVVNRLPQIQNAKTLFITYHPDNGKENWRISKKKNDYYYSSPLEDKEQLMMINPAFDRVEAFLPARNKTLLVWHCSELIYDFLQVLMINYFNQRKIGIFTHAVGIKNSNGEGLLFAGRSGVGKTTTAKLWHKNTRAMILNDDRIIIRKSGREFFIHGSPWHGEFSDYLETRIEAARLKRIFFLEHAKKNSCQRLLKSEASKNFYPVVFPTFWDRRGLEEMFIFCQELLCRVPCYALRFKNDRRVIDFTNKIKEAPDKNV